MTPGRVIAVVGPSGVGKDSVMAGLMAADGSYQLVKRDITRAAELGGEDFTSLSPAQFAERQEAGAYCLSWQAHGLSYGIPARVQEQANAGQNYLINLSRAVLAEAHEVFADFRVLNLTASAEVLAKRLAGRGRESAEGIAQRLARSGADLPAHLRVVTVSNNGALADTIAEARALLQPERV
ncbi:phosphonate metabolism protein/1,5-bisphosphokinase (PRPP-forming) PhnN [Tropicibacter sp. R15_0]|uniref:phosphonate metabolism protein/1,5-bisphosphokinase (PRPP-forming) PhnN n=1 Tax=Tropicibacter sp. R15_0 TaxID=2821101 RepID=UPI001ADD119B|nr:phosphonate metabolism protein/1,5-bisphosphokinase (PRPP-forming) PhnN [Tropicibacter sp. R15_0]MBO9465266.1 phosphonate metabolism protein/1,5-bisphosphokinase (PRPP-forming) PhnN [Tropicibacter sp. R15_0]